jgi:hypothetical protein
MSGARHDPTRSDHGGPEPLRAISGGLDPSTRPKWRRWDAEFQHRWTRFRPFLMDRVGSHLHATPDACRWPMYLLLQRCDDDGWWKGTRRHLMSIFGLRPDTFERRMKAMKDAGVLTYNWRGDGSGWVRITGFHGFRDHTGDR